MVLYLSALSKNHVGYTPDTLIVELENKHFEYDIQGWTDYDNDGLYCRTKGDLFIRNDKDEFVDLNENDERELIEMLNDKNARVSVAIYPSMTDENDADTVNTDELTDCQGTLFIREMEANFKFATEFYGL